jgi:hypothetical protein
MGSTSVSELESARRATTLSRVDLWVRFFGLGGTASAAEFDRYLSGALQPTKTEHNIAVQALNEYHLEHGENHPVPYLD